MKRTIVVLSLLVLSLSALPAVADTVYSGIDTWSTKPNGQSFHDFSREPLPAGFFCDRSAAFTDRVALQGVPIASDEPTLMGNTDTIIERLDDATFNRMGVASTRIRVRALSLASVSPIRTACGAYDVRVNLIGQQPTTLMKIFKEGEDEGRFLAPLSLRVKITFSPVSGRGRTLEVVRAVHFEANPRNHWSMRPTEQMREIPELLRVDTNGDDVPDAYVKGPSNFAGGRSSQQDKDNCHMGYDAYHCPNPDGSWNTFLMANPER